MSEKFKRVNIIFIVSIFIFAVVNYIELIYGNGNVFNVMIVWNIFLAYLPLLFSTLVYKNRSKFTEILKMFLWLIFWPNAIYVVTDYVHLQNIQFYSYISGTNIYTTDIFVWMGLLSLTIGFLYSILTTVISEIYIEEYLQQKLNRFNKNIFRIVVSLLGGVAIYIGRFLRLNSWDIFNITKYIQKIKKIGHSPAFIILFIFIFAVYIFIIISTGNYIRNKNK